jgi:localization factor PodJL
MWLNLAAAQGNADAARARDELAAKMTPAQIEKAQALAAAWKPTTGQ